MNKMWFDGFLRRDILIIEYELLVRNTEDELRRVLRFLGTDFDDKEAKEESIRCAMKRKKGFYQRKKEKSNRKNDKYQPLLPEHLIFNTSILHTFEDTRKRVYKYIGLM